MSRLSMRVLIVEDNEDAGATLRLLLESLGHEVLHVTSGEDALARVGKFRPRVVLLDLGLPGIQGHEAAVRIREKLAGQPLAIVATSGWGRDEDRERSKAARIDHHLVKPVKMEELLRILESAAAD
jgi:CheY-like chemotaxis protein